MAFSTQNYFTIAAQIRELLYTFQSVADCRNRIFDANTNSYPTTDKHSVHTRWCILIRSCSWTPKLPWKRARTLAKESMITSPLLFTGSYCSFTPGIRVEWNCSTEWNTGFVRSFVHIQSGRSRCVH